MLNHYHSIKARAQTAACKGSDRDGTTSSCESSLLTPCVVTFTLDSFPCTGRDIADAYGEFWISAKCIGRRELRAALPSWVGMAGICT